MNLKTVTFLLSRQKTSLIKQNIHHARLLLHPKLLKSTSDTLNALESINIITNNEDVIAFQHIINYCSSLSLTFLPSEMYVDFEDGIHKSIKKSGPMLELKNVDSIWVKTGNEKFTNDSV